MLFLEKPIIDFKSRPRKEHSVSLRFSFQSAAAEALPEGPFLVSALCAIAPRDVMFLSYLRLSLGFLWYWTEIDATLKTKPTSGVWLMHSIC